jgi:hypothetical protein
MLTTFRKHPSIPCKTKARLALIQSGYTYRSVAEIMRGRGIVVSHQNVRHVVAGVTKRSDVRLLIAELTGKPMQTLWPDETRDPLVS